VKNVSESSSTEPKRWLPTSEFTALYGRNRNLAARKTNWWTKRNWRACGQGHYRSHRRRRCSARNAFAWNGP